MHFYSVVLPVVFLVPLLFDSSEARPGGSTPVPLPTNATSFTSIHTSPTEAVLDTSVIASFAQVFRTSIHPSSTMRKASSASAMESAVSNYSNSSTWSLVSPTPSSLGFQPSSTQTVPVSKVTPASSNFWNYRNSLFGSTFIQTGIPPGLVNHNEELFVVYTNGSNYLYYAIGNNDNFGSPVLFVDNSGIPYQVSNTQAPALASFYGDLHAVIEQNNNLLHFIFNDITTAWEFQSMVASSYSDPTLAVFNEQLYLAMVTDSGNSLEFCFWTQDSGWSAIASANGETTWGLPALYTLEASGDYALFLLFAVKDSSRQIQNLIYDVVNQTWSRVPSPPPESTAFGVSAASGDAMAFMGFQENANSGNVYVSIFDELWANHEDTGQSSSDTPSLAVLDGVVNVIFDSRNANRDILWTQRPLAGYSLKTWMSGLDNDSYISSLSIPGTHDSTAISDFPTVGCQMMSITEQLNAGIRYLDLRSGLVDNVLYMYHGEYYRINPPDYLTLATVIEEILQWLSTHSSEAVMVQIKQDSAPDDSNISFATAVSQVLGQNPGYWSLGTSVPALGDIRGRMQLMRRYSVNQNAGEQAIGIDLTQWPDNNPRFEISTPSGAYLVVQDQYEFGVVLDHLVTNKMALVQSLLEEAADDEDTTTWYINFASATQFPPLIGPKTIAVGGHQTNPLPIIALTPFVNGVNFQLRWAFYGLPTNQRYGTILMDFPESPEDDLIFRIVATNFM